MQHYYTARTVNAMHKTEREIILIRIFIIYQKRRLKSMKKREMSIVDKMLRFHDLIMEISSVIFPYLIVSFY